MYVGKVSKLFPDKGYGSIRTTDGENVHFHKQCLWDIEFDELTEGQEVEFEVQPSYKGYLAFHIRPVIKEAAQK
ncbi:MAG: cold shock domain-containing protein [Candidatus Omnitrophica bacterium]|nr:cold shock domain-containing protein [Candidatus Omnitrophota bacterium]